MIEQRVSEKRAGYITYSNVHVVVTSKKNEMLRKAINQAFIASPDGMPLVWMGKLKGMKQMERCTGPDMMEEIINYGIDKNWSHYFFGGKEEVLDQLVFCLKNRYPQINIVGKNSPPFDDEYILHSEKILDDIDEKKPMFIWVGLGAPKQELWMLRHYERFNQSIVLGVGAAFDFHSNYIKRAPTWVQKCGLEWMYRLIQEPKRLFKRYLVTNMIFIWSIITQGVQKVL